MNSIKEKIKNKIKEYFETRKDDIDSVTFTHESFVEIIGNLFDDEIINFNIKEGIDRNKKKFNLVVYYGDYINGKSISFYSCMMIDCNIKIYDRNLDKMCECIANWQKKCNKLKVELKRLENKKALIVK
jgi:hypothetical protein